MITTIMCYEICVGDKITDLLNEQPLVVKNVELDFKNCVVEVETEEWVHFYDFYYEVEKHEPDTMYQTNYAELIEWLEF